MWWRARCVTFHLDHRHRSVLSVFSSPADGGAGWLGSRSARFLPERELVLLLGALRNRVWPKVLGSKNIFQREGWDSGLQTCIFLSVCILNVKCYVVHYIFRNFKLESPRSWSSPRFRSCSKPVAVCLPSSFSVSGVGFWQKSLHSLDEWGRSWCCLCQVSSKHELQLQIG